MFQINCLNPISGMGLDLLTESYAITDDFASADAALVRSASVHELPLSDKLLAVARAGAGVNNIPLDKCAEKGIVVFNTPGANANGVKELALAGMLLAARDIVGGINWVQTVKDDENVAKLVEKGKKAYAGTEIMGKKLGVIGLGAIGGLLANAAASLGMEVYGCDPYLSVEAAWHLSHRVHHVKSNEEIFAACDYISIHVPLMDATRGMINADTIAMMKDGVVVLNFARDALVDDDAMAAALKSGKVKRYVTDFPNAKSAGMEGAIAIPHLGASTEESEDNCAVMAVRQMMDYLENGNIKNSVNLPNAEMARSGVSRICVFHRNVPNVIAALTSEVGKHCNIENMVNASKGEYAYTMLDLSAAPDDSMIAALTGIAEVTRIRVI